MTIQTIVPVTVQGGAAPAGDIDFNYTDTADLKSSSHGWILGNRSGWEIADDHHPERIFLDNLVYAPGSPTLKSMRYDYPDRTSEVTPGLCHDYPIYRNWKFASPVTELWLETTFMLDQLFDLVVPGGVCTGVSAPGLKFVFPGLVQNPNVGRFDSILQPNFLSATHPSGNALPSGNYNASTANSRQLGLQYNTMNFHRGVWSTLRFHCKCTTAWNYPTGIKETSTCRAGSTVNRIELAAGAGGSTAPNDFIIITYVNGEISGASVSSISGAGGATPAVICKWPTNVLRAPAAGDTYRIATQPLQGDGIFGVEVIGIGRSVGTNLVTGATDVATKSFYLGSAQRINGFALNRNMNQGPTHPQSEWWGRIFYWTSDPGWGW